MSTSVATQPAQSGADLAVADAEGAELSALLAQLAAVDVRLSVERGRLVYDAPEGVMSLELRRAILAHKSPRCGVG